MECLSHILSALTHSRTFTCHTHTKAMTVMLTSMSEKCVVDKFPVPSPEENIALGL